MSINGELSQRECDAAKRELLIGQLHEQGVHRDVIAARTGVTPKRVSRILARMGFVDDRRARVHELVAEGLPAKAIARRLDVSLKVVHGDIAAGDPR